MSLQPGDVILTGTPAGVGIGQRAPVEATIGGRGTHRHRVVAPSASCEGR